METTIDFQADRLAAKVKHYLITTMGRTSDEADDNEFFRAFSFAFREEIMINWLATARTNASTDARMLFYLSMEYLPGRLLSNNITNVKACELVKAVMVKLDRKYNKILSYEADPGLGNGGLGRLASCFLDSMATQRYPVRAYGLRYQYGIFEQQIWDGEQVEAPDTWLLNENPWEFRRDFRKQTVKFCGRASEAVNIENEPTQNLHDYEEVRAIPFDIPIIGYSPQQNFSVLTLRLWSTKESPRNFQLQRYNAGHLDQAAENTTLTDVLYPADYHDRGKRTRLKQEFLLVSASLQDLIRHYLEKHDNLHEFRDRVRIQINDTHPSLVVPELIRMLNSRYDVPWKTAIEITQQCLGYTNHTILSEALEEWDQKLMKYLLPRQYQIIERLNQEFCDKVRVQFPDDEEKVRRLSILEGGKVRMANLAIAGSHKVNGVAKLHGEILKEKVFKDFHDLYPEKFLYVTNGVTQRRWLLHCNPELSDFIIDRIGDGWITDFSQIQRLSEYAKDKSALEQLMRIKQNNKANLVHYLETHEQGHSFKQKNSLSPSIDTDSLFDVQIKRIHEYKRQLMNALHIIMLYNEIRKNPGHNRIKRTFIFAGKAAASYERAKQVIRLICCIARRVNQDTQINDRIKVAFIENYNVSKAELIIPAADLSEQISTAGMEASGTGNMKLAINGALTIGTKDGANIEMEEQTGSEWWPFGFGCSTDEINRMYLDQSYHSWDICSDHPQIREAVEMLRDRSFADTDDEHADFCQLYDSLLEGHYGANPDRYFVLKDLGAYYEAQKKVEELYREPYCWYEYVVRNIAGMGMFSTDRSIEKYAREIWGIKPVPPDSQILAKVRHEYSEHDKCRIY